MTVFKIIIAAGLISLLAACSSIGTSSAGSSRASDVPAGGPRGASGCGP